MPANCPFVIVDAFITERPFSGNPAGVLLLEEFPDSGWMQGVANELQQAETAFLVPVGDGVFQLRWFTPVAEVVLCGHATLASAHWLWESGVLPSDVSATFTTRSGHLQAVLEDKQIVLDFPSVPATPVPTSPQLLRALPGAVPVWTGVTEDSDPKERNILAVLDSEDAVRNLAPDLREVERLPVGGLIVTAKRRAGGVVSRYFAPAVGIPEDSVTGSAHCTIAPYWRAELGTRLFAEQASHRGGELTVELKEAGRVLLAGAARTAVTGEVR